MEKKVMTVYNLTDVETAQLKQYGLVSQHIVVGKALVAPGESAEVADDSVTRNGLQHYVAVGAIAVDSLPPLYALQKEKLLAAAPKVEENKPVPFVKKKDK